MTVRKRFKRLVRGRAGATGESYTTALAHFRRIAEEANMSQASDRFLGLEDSEYEQMGSLDGLRPEMVTEALRRVGSSSQVTACEQARQSRYNFSYDIVLDGAPAALNVWCGASPAGAEAELALRRRLVSCGLPVQRALVPAADERLTVGGQPAVVLERIEGEEGPNYVPTKVSDTYVETAAAVARLVAKMQVSAMGLEELDYREPPWLSNLASWKTELDMAKADGRAMAALDAIDSAARRFQVFCDGARLPVGVAHGCPGPWTVLVDDARQIVALLELDSAHRDHLVFDVAHLITQWGQVAVSETKSRFEPVLVERILKEYSAVRPLSVAEREALVTAVPLRHCIDLLRIWNAVGNKQLVPFSWSEYLDRMQVERFEDSEWRELVMGVG
ncbi:MAG: phosphotransferase [Gammaproteobacteria bacterium]|nr:phosphotransferase [Gammaproteobacteria bacterium]